LNFHGSLREHFHAAIDVGLPPVTHSPCVTVEQIDGQLDDSA
jgi:hypothetical protein